MGGGASKKPTRYRPGGVVAIVEHACNSPRPGMDAAAGRPAGATQRGSIDERWHRKNCAPQFLVLARTIDEAYPFDHDAKKVVKKEEKVWGMHDRKDGFGHVVVTKTGPRKLHCKVCARLLIDRDRDSTAGEKTFYFCRRCCDNGRRFHICLRCRQEEQQAFAQPIDGLDANKVAEVSVSNSAHLAPPVRKKERSRTDPGPSISPRQLSKGSTDTSLSVGRANSRAHTAAVASSAPPPKLPSSMWRGTITEDGFAREANIELAFHEGGVLTGSGPDKTNKITVSGNWKEVEQNEIYTVNWVEVHQWGKLRVTGRLIIMQETCRIRGKVTATDGGEALLDLNLPMQGVALPRAVSARSAAALGAISGFISN